MILCLRDRILAYLKRREIDLMAGVVSLVDAAHDEWSRRDFAPIECGKPSQKADTRAWISQFAKYPSQVRASRHRQGTPFEDIHEPALQSRAEKCQQIRLRSLPIVKDTPGVI